MSSHHLWSAFMVEGLHHGEELQPAVIGLRAFHNEMSFCESIGQLMSGSGLQELLEVVYANNAVGHMLSGKAVSRAVRGHLLVDAALNAMVTSGALNKQLQISLNIHVTVAAGGWMVEEERERRRRRRRHS